jgi:hypothetical protein
LQQRSSNKKICGGPSFACTALQPAATVKACVAEILDSFTVHLE